jgi:hypothetical protein
MKRDAWARLLLPCEGPGEPQRRGSMNQRQQQAFWASQLHFFNALLAWTESLPTIYAGEVLRAIRAGNNRKIDAYFKRQLGRRLTPEDLLALYTILNRSNTWRKVNGLRLTKYLGWSVSLEGKRIRRKRETEGRLTPLQREMEHRAALELDEVRSRIPRPDEDVVLEEERKLEDLFLKRVFAGIKGTERDRRILDLVFVKGLSPSEAVSELGLKMSAWEALRGKLERCGVKEPRILRSEMSSKRVSAA